MWMLRISLVLTETLVCFTLTNHLDRYHLSSSFWVFGLRLAQNSLERNWIASLLKKLSICFPWAIRLWFLCIQERIPFVLPGLLFIWRKNRACLDILTVRIVPNMIFLSVKWGKTKIRMSESFLKVALVFIMLVCCVRIEI